MRSAAVPVSLLILVVLIATVVLLPRLFKAEVETDESVTEMEYALPVSLSPASVSISPSEMVAVTTPVVAAARVLACEVLAVPVLTLRFSSPRLLMPEEA